MLLLILAFFAVNLVLRESILVGAACPTTLSQGECGPFCVDRGGGEGTGWVWEAFRDTRSYSCGKGSTCYEDFDSQQKRYYCKHKAGHGSNAHLSNDECSAGTYSGGGWDAQCVSCQTGHVSNNGAGSCQSCVAGKYRNSVSTCASCSHGKYSNSGAISCDFCARGENPQKVPNSGKTGCETCPLGQYGTANGNCHSCTAGKYSPEKGKACVDCPAGKHQNEEKKTECKICPSGTFSMVGQSSCQDCAEGTYQDEVGKGSCKDCPTGSYNPNKGETESTCTSCPAGKVRSNNDEEKRGRMNLTLTYSIDSIARSFFSIRNLKGLQRLVIVLTAPPENTSPTTTIILCTTHYPTA